VGLVSKGFLAPLSVMLDLIKRSKINKNAQIYIPNARYFILLLLISYYALT